MTYESFQPNLSKTTNTEVTSRLVSDIWSQPVQESNVQFSVTDYAKRPTDKPVKSNEQLMQEMLKDAVNGKLNASGRELLTRSFQTGDLEVFLKTVIEINRRLEESRSAYRISVCGLVDPNSGEAVMGLALTTAKEDWHAIIHDIVKYGQNSKYKDRGMVIHT